MSTTVCWDKLKGIREAPLKCIKSHVCSSITNKCKKRLAYLTTFNWNLGCQCQWPKPNIKKNNKYVIDINSYEGRW